MFIDRHPPVRQGRTGGAGEANERSECSVSRMERYVFDEDVRKLHGRVGRERCIANTWQSAVAPLVKRLKAQMEEDY